MRKNGPWKNAGRMQRAAKPQGLKDPDFQSWRAGTLVTLDQRVPAPKAFLRAVALEVDTFSFSAVL